MKRALLHCLTLLLLPLLLPAQYQKATVRLLSGETIKGYIDQQTEVELKNRIHFKASLSTGTYEVYSPNEIAGFDFERGSAFDAIETVTKREDLVLKERTFAKLVARGAIDLYLFQRDIEEGEFEFYARKNGRLHRLTQERVELYPDVYLLRNRYQGVLNALTFDCRNRIGDIQEVPYSRKHIVEMIDSYNACQDPSYQPIGNAYKVDKEKRYFIEFFGGPLIGRRNFGATQGGDRLISREIFVTVGVGGQVEIYKPSLSRKLLIHNSLEAFKWVSWQESGVIDPPALSLAYNISAHYLFDEQARYKFFTRLGASFMVDIDQDILPRPGISLGLGTYLPAGGRLTLQLSSISILGTEGITTWRAGYAIPLGSVWK